MFLSAAPKAANKSADSQRGFTLVELAIVLVIIGLVIGAVLKGQELIASARVKSTLTQVDAIRSATATFRDKYHVLPGDMDGTATTGDAAVRLLGPAGLNAWGCTTCNGSAGKGDANGVIDGDGVVDETLAFWNHLAAANLVTGLDPQATVGIGDAFPSAPVGGALTVRNEAVVGKTDHWLTVGSAVGVTAFPDVTTVGTVDSEQASRMDEKVDDGRPGTGSMRNTLPACNVGGLATTNISRYEPTPAANCVIKFEL